MKFALLTLMTLFTLNSMASVGLSSKIKKPSLLKKKIVEYGATKVNMADPTMSGSSHTNCPFKNNVALNTNTNNGGTAPVRITKKQNGIVDNNNF